MSWIRLKTAHRCILIPQARSFLLTASEKVRKSVGAGGSPPTSEHCFTEDFASDSNGEACARLCKACPFQPRKSLVYEKNTWEQTRVTAILKWLSHSYQCHVLRWHKSNEAVPLIQVLFFLWYIGHTLSTSLRLIWKLILLIPRRLLVYSTRYREENLLMVQPTCSRENVKTETLFIH